MCCVFWRVRNPHSGMIWFSAADLPISCSGNSVEGTMTDAAALLQELGFSEYEARAYVALLQRSPLNGYELAKASGLPRANGYSVLRTLEDRGAGVRRG